MTRVEVEVDGTTVSTTCEPGESWLGAARRTTATRGVAEPVAVDLSGEVKRFVVDTTTTVSVRPMTRGDFPDVLAWRAADHVRRWWIDGMDSLERAETKYGPRVDGASPTAMWVWEVNGRSVGYVQDYRIGDHPDYALLVPDPDARGVDYLVGEVGWVGRGVGTRCLWAWLLHVRDRHPELRHCFAAPDHRNRASLRVLGKVGFTEGLWFDEPQDDGSVDTVVGCTLDLREVVGAPE